MGKSWCVVEFDDGVQIVPQIWIEGDMCYWPTTFKSVNSQKLFETAVKDYKYPEKTWDLHQVRILGVYDSYEQAIPKLKLAEIQSDLNTDEEPCKKSRAFRKRVIQSSDEDCPNSDEEILPVKPFPNVPKNIYIDESDSENMRVHNFSTNKILNLPKRTPLDESGIEDSRCDYSNTENTNRLPKRLSLYNSGSEAATVYSTPKNKRQMVDQLTYTSKRVSSYGDTTNSTAIQMTNECCICCCRFDKEYKRKAENDLNEVKNQLKLVLQILRERRPQTVTEHSENDYEDYDSRLPIKTDEDVAVWENDLSKKEEQKKMISYLARIGGHEINTVVKNILRKVFKDSVAALYNWEGKKGKKMFSSLIISDCIKKAAVISPNTNAKATEQDIITAIKNWLRHASARLGNSQKKESQENE